jgi:V-type H+-transporting ATPase subunit C
MLNMPPDVDGNVIYTMTVMREQVNDYIKVLKKNGYVAQQFDYDLQAHQGREKKRIELSKELEATLGRAQKYVNMHYSTVFKALTHVKIMRVFVDSVLRFGLPRESRFFMGIIKPNPGMDAKIFTALTDQFAEDHLKEFYGEK